MKMKIVVSIDDEIISEFDADESGSMDVEYSKNWAHISIALLRDCANNLENYCNVEKNNITK